MRVAEQGIAELRKHVDSIIVIPNDRLKLLETDEPITLANAFDMADNILRQGVQCISDVINVPGIINLDFADVESVMRNMGYAHMGVGRGSGKDKARVAATSAIDSPLLETKIDGAKGIILNIIASADIDLNDVELAANMFKEAADSEANIIWGVAFSDEMDDEMSITAIATGFDEMLSQPTAPAPVVTSTPKEEPPVEEAPKVEPPVENKPAEPEPENKAAATQDTSAWSIEDFDDFIKILQNKNSPRNE